METVVLPNLLYSLIEAFEDGWTMADDYEHPGRPISTGYQGNIDLVSRIIDMNRRLNVRQLEETLGMPRTIRHILTEDLRTSSVVARWVFKLLTDDMTGLSALMIFLFDIRHYLLLSHSFESLLVILIY